MTYKINITDGSLLTELPDGTIDVDSTSLTLIGKNAVNFGEAINENFVKLLENFASVSSPNNALTGQLWFNTSTGQLNVYDGNSFRVTGGPIVSPVQPATLVSGDLWINNRTNQMYFFDGEDLVLTGPLYSNDQGITGFRVSTVLDATNRSHTICQLFVADTLLGIFSKTEFTPRTLIAGYSSILKLVKVGFNAAEQLSNIKFDVTVTRAETILTDQGVPKTASKLVFTDAENVLEYPLTIVSEDGINIANDLSLRYSNNNIVLNNARLNGDVLIKVNKNTVTTNAITIKTSTGRVGLFTNDPQATLDVAGDAVINGNLTVNGATTTINSTQISVDDINIVLGDSANPTDVTANGGGITLRSNTVGTGDKTLIWSGITSSWTSNQNIDINTGRTYKINSTDVLSSTGLGSGIVNSSLTSVGKLNTLQMAGDGNAVSITGRNIGVLTGNLILNPDSAAGNVSVSGKKLINLANPTTDTDAVNYQTLATLTYNRSLAFTLDITQLTDSIVEGGGETLDTRIEDILNVIMPLYDPLSSNTEQQTGTVLNGTILRLHCTRLVSITSSEVTFNTTNIIKTDAAVLSIDGSTQEDVVKDFALTNLAAPTISFVTERFNKKFIMGGTDGLSPGQWKFVEDI
jgi:hypothetical protein